MRLVVDIFGPRENSSSTTPIEGQRNLRRLALIAPHEYPDVADAVDEALADLAGRGPLVEREMEALRIRYALDEPGVLYNTYSEVGLRLPAYPSDSTLGPIGIGIGSGRARELTHKGFRALSIRSKGFAIYGFRVPT